MRRSLAELALLLGASALFARLPALPPDGTARRMCELRQESLVLVARGQLPLAKARLDQGIALGRGPLNWLLYGAPLSRLHLARARVEIRAGERAAARQDAEKAARLDPSP